jgi:hypothetical protein
MCFRIPPTALRSGRHVLDGSLTPLRSPLRFQNNFKRFRSFSTTLRVANDESAHADLPDFGTYSVILPQEPFVFGTAHITPRDVPSHIGRPLYVGAPQNAPHDGDPWHGDGRVELGSEAEHRVRAAAALARDVLKHAERLVKVRFLPFTLLLSRSYGLPSVAWRYH